MTGTVGREGGSGMEPRRPRSFRCRTGVLRGAPGRVERSRYRSGVTDAEPPRRRRGMREVARAAGVSTSTVGNVVNNPQRVAPETRRRVERAMAEVGFV
ncbi:LacI family DNA-binding transcriptional regulator, partial [Glycomyces tenuis]|uniref:LacI family DNA-binding transcriptional regulator n=1 Tax=Glycomyces tenuis TaxID=58116 RepID=UPI001B8063F6